jgi:hypothetical protein
MNLYDWLTNTNYSFDKYNIIIFKIVVISN